MKIVYMGTPAFAVPCLKAILKEGHEVVGVFSQPDKPKGRGNHLAMPPVKEAAIEEGLTVFQPSSLKDPKTLALIQSLAPDLIVVVAYGHILTKDILDIPPFGCINVHASLLPQYRGAAPINWAVIHGQQETGITTMYMDVGLDTGDMILKQSLFIGENETAGQLHDRLALLGADTLRKTLDMIERAVVERIPQEEEASTYAPMMKKELGEIDWEREAQAIHNLIRGTIPWPSAYTTYGNQVMKIWKSRVESTEKDTTPGKIEKITKDEIYVGTGKGFLVIKELQFSGGKRMEVRRYLVGNQLDTSVILGAADS